MKRFETCIRAFDAASAKLGRAASWAIILLMLIMVFEVVTRRVLNQPSVWTFETSTQIYAFHFMILAAYTLLAGRHISVDIIASRWSGRTRAIVDAVLYLLFFFPFVTVLLIEGTIYAREAWAIKEVSFTVFAPPVYPIKTVIPITALLLFLQGLSEFFKKLYFIAKGVQL